MPGPFAPLPFGPGGAGGGGFVGPPSTDPPPFIPGVAPVTAANGAPDLVTVALSRLISQYQGKPKLTARILLTVYLLQDVANALMLIPLLDDPDQASGVNLDVTASLVGQGRVMAGYYVASDAELRILIALRKIRNRSIGSGPEIIEALRALVNDATLITYTSPGMMYIDLQMARQPTAFEVAAIHDDLIPRPMGVGLDASWYVAGNFVGWDDDPDPGAVGLSEIGDDSIGGYLAEFI
jgi:hypothetical protein